jgi:hypothetical protein
MKSHRCDHVFFNNPFAGKILADVLDKIQVSYELDRVQSRSFAPFRPSLPSAADLPT